MQGWGLPGGLWPQRGALTQHTRGLEGFGGSESTAEPCSSQAGEEGRVGWTSARRQGGPDPSDPGH